MGSDKDNSCCNAWNLFCKGDERPANVIPPGGFLPLTRQSLCKLHNGKTKPSRALHPLSRSTRMGNQQFIKTLPTSTQLFSMSCCHLSGRQKRPSSGYLGVYNSPDDRGNDCPYKKLKHRKFFDYGLPHNSFDADSTFSGVARGCSEEEVAVQLLQLNKQHYTDSSQGKEPQSYSTSGETLLTTDGDHAKTYEQYDCSFCNNVYGSLSALTLHIRQKHVEVATVMMGLDPEHQLLPIHARSIAAYINNAMTRRHVMPVMTASEALSRHRVILKQQPQWRNWQQKPESQEMRLISDSRLRCSSSVIHDELKLPRDCAPMAQKSCTVVAR